MRVLIALGAILAGVAIYGSIVLWRAGRAVRISTERIASESRIAFTDAPLGGPAPAGFDSMSAPSGFRDAAVFNGHLWIGGAAGVFEYDTEGRILNSYRAGIELPSAPVSAVAVGPLGADGAPALWIATQGEGAVVYRVSAFRHLRPELARFRKMSAVLPLSTGRVLFGTATAGVIAFDGRGFSPLHESLSGLHVTVLAGDESSLWIGTEDMGLVHWHAGETDRIGETNGLPDARISAIAVAGDTTYAATALGIAEIRDGKVQRTLAPGYTVQSVVVQGRELLAGTLDEGFIRIPLEARAASARPESPGCANCGIERLINVGGEILALTSNGLFRTGPKRVEWSSLLAPADTRLTDRNIAAMARDSRGTLWIGYFDRGLDIVDSGAVHPRHVEDDVLFCVNRIVHDGQRSRVAVATANGLAIFSPGGERRQVLTRSDGLIANQVTDVLVRPDGSLVAGTPAGVSFVDSSGISSIYAFHGLANNHVYALGQVGSRILAGTLGGLSVIESGLAAVRFTTANSGFKHNWITAVLPAANDVFIGTYGGGIMHMSADGSWQPFADLPASFEVNPNAMAASDRAVYAGTLSRGLAVYDMSSSRWRWITRGLPSMNVTAVAVQSGIVYAGTDNGLVRVPEEALVR